MKFLPEHADRVAELQAMTWDELVAECDSILARYLTDPDAKAEARAHAGSYPNPARIAARLDAEEYRSGTRRAVGQISTGG